MIFKTAKIEVHITEVPEVLAFKKKIEMFEIRVPDTVSLTPITKGKGNQLLDIGVFNI